MEYLRLDRKEPNLTGRLFVQLFSEIEQLAEEIMTDKEQVKQLWLNFRDRSHICLFAYSGSIMYLKVCYMLAILEVK